MTRSGIFSPRNTVLCLFTTRVVSDSRPAVTGLCLADDLGLSATL